MRKLNYRSIGARRYDYNGLEKDILKLQQGHSSRRERLNLKYQVYLTGRMNHNTPSL